MNITQFQDGPFAAYRLAAHDVEVEAIPELGGKISSIRVAGEEVLDRAPRPDSHRPTYAAPYTGLDSWGFDECLPTIGACRYPEHPWQGIEAPDHGEVWSVPWVVQEVPSGLRLKASGVRFPYKIRKVISLPAPGRVHLRYSLTNFAHLPFHYLWSSHPLIALRPGMRLYLPEGIDVTVGFSKNERLGKGGTTHAWPHARDGAGQAIDISRLLPRESGAADKLYTSRLAEGWCAVHDPASRRYVAMLFSPEEIPYLGLWLNQGGWPLEGPGHYNLGLEPCRGIPDHLDVAIERGTCSTAQGGETHEWHLDICAGAADDMPAELERLRASLKP